MTEHLSPESLNSLDPDEQSSLRVRSRSPHPYHHQNTDLPHLSDRFSLRNRQAQSTGSGDDAQLEPSSTAWPPLPRDSPQTSDSGSEADDEHFWKGLPAPKTNLHKGLRGLNEPLSGSSTPLPSPAGLDGHAVRAVEKALTPVDTPESRRLLEALRRRRRVIARRITEAGIVLALGLMVASNPQVSRLLDIWGKDILFLAISYTGLLILYPLRVVAWGYRNHSPTHPIPLELPAHFDPAPLLYPPAITLFVSLLVSSNNPAGVLPNLVLSLCSIPQSVIPKVNPYATYDIQILKALLWGGGLSLLVFCGPVIRWGIALARVPKWRFRRASVSQSPPLWKSLAQAFSLRRMKNELLRTNFEETVYDTVGSSEDEAGPLFRKPTRVKTFGPSYPVTADADSVPSSPTAGDDTFANGTSFVRRHTLSHMDHVVRRNATHTPSGRKKRATSMSVRPFFKLTQEQATLRKWLYAGYVYACILTIILVGIRTYVQKFALDGNEPIGWALGYLFGDLPWFRYQVVMANLERWICLPSRSGSEPEKAMPLWLGAAYSP
ncbi:dolichol kinase [Fusarium falciforme]|nr:dolichol kinase [Fusarium falciforme]